MSENIVKLQNNRMILIRGDCRKEMQRIKPNSIDCVVTDPAYKLISGGVSGLMQHGIFDPSVYNNNGNLFPTLKYSEWIPSLPKILKYSASDIYIMVNDKNMLEALNSLQAQKLKLHNVLVWDKGIYTPNKWYMKCCEFILYAWYGNAKTINNMGSSQMQRIKPIIGNRVMPSEKPIKLMEEFIKNSTQPNDIVLDPFMGSGTTGVACVNLSRRFIGIEKDTDQDGNSLGYFDIAVNRITQAIAQRESNVVYG